MADLFSRRRFVKFIASFGAAASLLGLKSSEVGAAEGKETTAMAGDPDKAHYLKWLILWINDWQDDANRLQKAMHDMPGAPSQRRAVPSPFEIPAPPPPPPMSASPQDYEWCAAYFQTIAYNNYVTALGVLQVPRDPNGDDIAEPLNYDDVNSLDAANEWMRLASNLFKGMIRFYPVKGSDLPKLPPEEPEKSTTDDEGASWGSLKTALQLLAKGAMDFVERHFSGKAMQMPSPGNEPTPSKSACIKHIEASAHQILMDYSRIADHLPDHFQRPGPGGFRILTK